MPQTSSEYTQAEQDRQRLGAIVSSSLFAIVSKDLSAIVTSWNAGAERLFGYTAEEMIGKSITLLIPAHLQQQESSILERVIHGKQVEYYETTRARKDGTLVKVSLSVSPIRDSQGRVVGAMKIAGDITARKKAELALADRDQQIRLAENVVRVGAFALDLETGWVQNSPGYATIHGMAEGTEEFPDHEWRARVHPDDLGRLEAHRAQAFAEKRRENNVEYRIVGPDGKVKWIESRALVSYDGDGHPTRMVGVNIVVTERKRAEEQQSLLIAELDHRVKNVLAGVALVARRTCEKATRDFIEALDRRIQSMADAHDLLSRNRWQEVGLADLVRRELAPYATNGNTVVEGPHVGLPAAATQAMAMVLHELATNAAKYGALSTPQGRVSVRWHLSSNGDVPARLRLEWREDGGPAVTAPTPGYGTSVIREYIL